MKGMVEIFRAGKHTDNGGRTREWTAADVARIAANYDPGYHEAPLVVGHPKTNAPAYGWVEKLTAEGGKLFAQFKQVEDGFRSAVRAGRFKHRSVALYPDLDGKGLYLRHVGFLGAAPPAVKGLEPLPAFSAADFAEFEFDNESEEGEMDEAKFKKLIEGAFTAFSEKVSSMLSALKPGGSGGGDPEPVAAIAAAVAQVKKDLTAQFSERIEASEGKVEKLTEQLGDERSKSHSGAVAQFVERQRTAGKWAPAWDKSGLVELMESLEGVAEIEFTEGEGDKAATVKQTPLACLQHFVERLPKVVEFGELTEKKGAGGAKVIGFTEDPGRQAEGHALAAATNRIMREKDITFEEASELAQQQLQTA